MRMESIQQASRVGRFPPFAPAALIPGFFAGAGVWYAVFREQGGIWGLAGLLAIASFIAACGVLWVWWVQRRPLASVRLFATACLAAGSALLLSKDAPTSYAFIALLSGLLPGIMAIQSFGLSDLPKA